MEGQGWRRAGREQRRWARRWGSNSTLRIELAGFGAGFEVRSEREAFSRAARFFATTASVDLPFTEMAETVENNRTDFVIFFFFFLKDQPYLYGFLQNICIYWDLLGSPVWN